MDRFDKADKVGPWMVWLAGGDFETRQLDSRRLAARAERPQSRASKPAAGKTSSTHDVLSHFACRHRLRRTSALHRPRRPRLHSDQSHPPA